ncbi:hypothetical protein T07_13303 [Trichinella nelsoni]|uniref:Uncharacterized protein n=1 Tax=Trichinella nelsoni TaxID=6336 RepID=A0A0V0SHI6_9BILA|nr:hypothetical protein T07_13303 [Trichinella nelsoni]
MYVVGFLGWNPHHIRKTPVKSFFPIFSIFLSKITPYVLSCICLTIPKIRSLTMKPVESEKTRLEEEPGTLQMQQN